MKQCVTTFMMLNFDLKNGMMMSFKIRLSESQALHIGIFPDEKTSGQIAGATKQAREQIAQMGAKSEPIVSPLTYLLITGDVTLD